MISDQVIDKPPKIERMDLQPEVVGLLTRILDMNAMIAKSLCSPPVIANFEQTESESSSG